MNKSKRPTNKPKKNSEKVLGEDFLIVGIGASAGGIQALKEFFENVPADSGMAYVVILHLSPDHDSRLAEVLQTVSPIPVTRVTKRINVVPNHVYVVPQNQHLAMIDGEINLAPTISTEERRAPVDIFFRTLAESHQSRAVAVVLSGTGANGSMGLKRIKERGGVCFVQNPREAEFSEMPRNAIATELVDRILNVAEIPAQIAAYRDSLGKIEIAVEPEARPEDQQQALREIFTQLRLRTGHDFSNYKRATVLRRIERRINVRHLQNLPSYANYCRDNTEETHALLRDLLISVTNFFRDKASFDYLEREILPKIFAGKTAEDQVRIWVAGCATGEEAYSIAMFVAEKTFGAIDAPDVQIFATDIDEQAIAAARDGFYTINDAADVSPERLRRFFTKEADGYRVRRELREMILFANHNVLKDPPFSRLDLATCRNMLIYLNGSAQERVMETFHFALNPGGYLFLGNSETVDGAGDLYTVVSREHHLYQSRLIANRIAYPVAESSSRTFRFDQFNLPVRRTERERETSDRERISSSELHLQLLELFTPSIMVNEDYDIVHSSESAARFLQWKGGEPTRNLLKLIRPEIRIELRTALYQAVEQNTNVEIKNLKLNLLEGEEIFNIYIRPTLTGSEIKNRFILILFEKGKNAGSDKQPAYRAAEPAVGQLEAELIRSKSQLRSAVEQYEIQAEELKASNEELQAMNEEMRSATEELETSKEELQSVNEELVTVNQELKVKIEELSQSNNDFQNLINSTDIATIFLDRSFRVNSFTPAAARIFNLIAADFGRPLSDITHRLEYENLQADAETVLDTLQTVGREVRTIEGRTFLMQILPYRTGEDRINGVVITFTDITTRIIAEAAVRASEEKYRTLFNTIDEAFALIEVICDESGKTADLFWIETNTVFEQHTGFAGTGKRMSEVVGEVESFWYELYDRVLKTGEPQRVEYAVEKLGRWYRAYLSRVGSAGSHLVALVFDDITERKRREANRNLLFEIGDDLSRLVTPDEIMQTVGSRLGAALGLTNCVFAEVDEDRDEIIVHHAWNNQNMPSLKRTFRIEDYLSPAERPGETVVVRDTSNDKRLNPKIYKRLKIGAFVTVPFYLNGRWTANFGVSDAKPRDWRNDEIELFREICDRVFPRIERARTEAALRESEQQQGFLFRLTDTLASFTDPLQIQKAGVSALGEYLDVNRVVYAELSGDEIFIQGDYVNGVSSLTGRHSLKAFGGSKLTETVKRSETVVIEDVERTAAFDDETKSAYAAGEVAALIGVGFFKEGIWTGAFAVHSSKPRQWTEREIKIVGEVAERIWSAVERAKAEKALAASEEKYRTLFGSIDEGFAVVEVIPDEHGSVTDLIYREANQAFERHSGMSDFIGKWVSEILPNLEQHWLDILTDVYQTGENRRIENFIGELDRWLNVHYSRVGGAGSRLVAVIFDDVTERKRREANLTFLAEVSQDLVHLTKIDETMNALGAKIGRFFGVKHCMFAEHADEAETTISAYGWHNEDVPDLRGTYRTRDYLSDDLITALRTGEPLTVRDTQTDARVNAENYAALGIHSFIIVPLIRAGEWRFQIFIIDDKARKWREDEIELMTELTTRIWARLERARAEEALRVSEERLRLATDAAEIGAWELDLRTNQSPVRSIMHDEIFGYKEPRDDWSLEIFLEHVHPDDRARVEKLFEQAFESGAWSFECRINAVGGALRWIAAQGNFFYDKNEQPVRAVGVVLDITERKLTEANLALLAEISQDLVLLSNIDDTMTLLGEKIGAYFKVARVLFSEISEDQQTILVTHEWHQTGLPDIRGSYQTREFFSPEFERLHSAGEITVVPDIAADDRINTERYRLHGVNSFVGVPLVREGDWRFYFSLLDSETHNWTEGEIELLREITSRIWTRLERARVEEALAESEERLRLATNAAQFGVWDWNYLTNQMRWSERLFEMFGIKPPDDRAMILETFTKFVHPDDLQELLEISRLDRENRQSFRHEYRIHRADTGELRWIAASQEFFYDETGNAVRCVGVARDITNRKQAEKALRESEERLRLLIESAADYAIFTMTLTGLIESWNTGAEKIFGWTESEIVGKSGEIIFTPEDKAKGIPEKEIKIALKKGRSPDERFHIRKDGSRFYVSGVMTTLKDTNGKVQGFVKIARDMTETIKAQQNRRDKEMLQKLVGAQEDERRRIARDLHDELGQQLTALRLKLDKTRKLCDDQDICAAIDEIQMLARNIDYGVDFLAWELRPAALDQFGLIPALENYLKQWTLFSGVTAELATSLKRKRFTPEIETNLYRILQEALNNVHKHARANKVFVSLEKRDDLLVLIIEDNGIGFNLKNKKYRANGIGLIGMKERAELIKGKLEIESASGEGTTIFVRIPIERGKKK